MFNATFTSSSEFTATLSGSGGMLPSGTVTITENEIVNVGEYANADIAVADDFPVLGRTWW